MEALGAARLGDQVGHGVGVLGMALGALAGVAVGLAVVAAAPLALAGGAAVLMTTAIIGGSVAGGALAAHQLVKGIKTLAHWPDPPTGVLSFGSINVNINDRSAIRASLDSTVVCSGGYGIYFSHPPFSGLVAAGSKTVRVNGQPAARITMPMTCGAKITSASEDVRIGGPTQVTDFVWDIAGGAELFFEVVGVLAVGGAVAAATWGGVVAGGLVGGMIGFGETGGAIALFAAALEGVGLVGETLGGEGGRNLAQGIVGGALLFGLPWYLKSQKAPPKDPAEELINDLFGPKSADETQRIIDRMKETGLSEAEKEKLFKDVWKKVKDASEKVKEDPEAEGNKVVEEEPAVELPTPEESGPSPLDTLPPGSKVISTDPNGNWVVFEDATGFKKIRFKADEAITMHAPSEAYNGTDETLAALSRDGIAYVIEGRHRVVAAAKGDEIPPYVGGVPGFPGWLQYNFESLRYKSGSGVPVRDLLPREEITYVKEGGEHEPLVSPLSEREQTLMKLYGPDSDSLPPAERQALEDKLYAPQPTGPRVKTKPLDQAKSNNGGDEPFNEASPPPPFEMEPTLGTPKDEYGEPLFYTDEDGVVHPVYKMSRDTGDPESLSANDDLYPGLAEEKQKLLQEQAEYEQLREEGFKNALESWEKEKAESEEYKKRAQEEAEEQGYEDTPEVSTPVDVPPDLYKDGTMQRRGAEFLESLEDSGRISPSYWASESYISEHGIPTIISSNPVKHARLLDALKAEIHRMLKEKSNVNEGKDYNFYEGDPYGNLRPYSDHWRPVKKPIYYKDADGVFRPLGDLAKVDTMDVGNSPILSTNDSRYKGRNDIPANDGRYPSETK